MAKILVTEPEYFSGEPIRILREAGTVALAAPGRQALKRKIKDAEVLVVRTGTKVDKDLLSAAPNLRLIASATTGLDHIDIEYAKAQGIRIISLHGTHTIPTAEHALALLLSLSRKIPWASRSLSSGVWKRYKFIGTELNGKTLGIIGLGRIGHRLAGYARALGMDVIAYDPYVKPGRTRMVSLGYLLKNSDVISIHAMLTSRTCGMLSAKQFKLMKPSVLLVNTARGLIVDSTALLAALSQGRIAGASLDVFPEEPLSDRNDPLMVYAREHENLIVTPHLGASTSESVRKAGAEIARKVVKYIN